MLLATTAWAGQVVYKTLTFPDGNESNVSSYSATWKATIDDFSWTLTNFNNNNSGWAYVKCGNKNTASVGTITTDAVIDKAITKVVVTIDAITANQVNSAKLIVATDAGFTDNKQEITVTPAKGENTYAVPTPTENCYYQLAYDCQKGSSNGLVTISKVEYYYEDASVVTYEAPTILINNTTPASSYYVSDLPLSLTITSNNGTETPYYAYTFTDPDGVTSSIRGNATELIIGDDAALNLQMGSNKLWVTEALYDSETQEYTASPWASATFTIKEDPTTVANIAEFNALDDDTDVTFNGTVTVLGQTGTNLYVQDSEKGMYIYGSTEQTYSFGDIIPAGFKGTKTTYKGAPEMTNPANFAASTQNVAPTAIEMTIADVNLDNFGRYGVIKNAKLNSATQLAVGEQTLTMFNRFGITMPTDYTKTYDIYGVASYYDGNQFLPLNLVEVETPVEFGINVTPAAGTYTEPQEIAISVTGAPEGETATITYTIGEGDEQTYTAPFTLYKSATITVMAECGELSDIQEYVYTINLPDLAFEMTPAPGTYQGEKEVTIACTNNIEGCDLDVMWSYTPEGETAIEGDETNMTFTATKSGVLTIVAEEANTGRTYSTPEGGLAYTITEPIELDGKIVFKDNDADNNTKLGSSDAAMAEITKGGDIVESMEVNDYVYAGATGLKLSNSNNAGQFTVNLTNKWNLTKIAVIAKAWTATNGNVDETSITLNGTTFELTSDFARYEIPFENAQEVQAISVVTTGSKQRAYVKVIDFEGEEIVPVTYTITLDNEPGEYQGKVVVKPTVTPEMPEGATLKYSIDGAEEAVVTEDGVTMSKSGTLTFNLYAADNTLLATAGGNYTISSLFGDLNGDGQVDVADVNILVNIILGNYHPNN